MSAQSSSVVNERLISDGDGGGGGVVGVVGVVVRLLLLLLLERKKLHILPCLEDEVDKKVFQQRDVLRDMPVTLSDGRQGTARGVDNTGVLRMETPQGMQLINSAEVRVRPSIEGV